MNTEDLVFGLLRQTQQLNDRLSRLEERFEASVDIFKIFLTMILLAALQLDYVPRAFADTRFILRVHVLRLIVTAILLSVLVGWLGMIGAALSSVLALGATKALIMLRVKTLLNVALRHLLPWHQLGRITAASAMAGIVMWLIQSTWSLQMGIKLFLSAAVFSALYAVLVWKLNGLDPHQKRWMIGRLQKFTRVSVGV